MSFSVSFTLTLSVCYLLKLITGWLVGHTNLHINRESLERVSAAKRIFLVLAPSLLFWVRPIIDSKIRAVFAPFDDLLTAKYWASVETDHMYFLLDAPQLRMEEWIPTLHTHSHCSLFTPETNQNSDKLTIQQYIFWFFYHLELYSKWPVMQWYGWPWK